MPKGGSGFMRAAGRAAAAIQRGSAGSWRLDNPGDYTQEITTLYRQMYRTGMRIVRDSSGRFKDYASTDRQLDRTTERLQNLANRISQHVQEYNETAAREYSQMRRTWSDNPVRTNAEEMREVRAGIRSGDTMLVNPRGGRNASDAATRAAETGWNATGLSNADILLEANRQMNATRRQIWTNAGNNGNAEQYSGDIFNDLLGRYERAERGAWGRRRRK